MAVHTSYKWTISLPMGLARDAERAAREAGWTKSGLVREALRLYIEERRWRTLQREMAARAQALGLQTEGDVVRLIRAGRR